MKTDNNKTSYILGWIFARMAQLRYHRKGTKPSNVDADYAKVAIEYPYDGIALLAADMSEYDSRKINDQDLIEAWKKLPDNLETALSASEYNFNRAAWIIGYYHCMLGIPLDRGLADADTDDHDNPPDEI